ncbi:MAG: hypothetical protein C0481_18490 [Phenylobacterium sp.]|uniref:hypothetical protein n=1 Tax=Phenylobacterium sp. TaxID=1871053 RepID=UPI0025FB71ED|nr:hypothetical protein [Phenylobacterium sp.]MBA4013856.1 hypothetical protein [Phenylobacterium sp.]
MKAVLQWLVRRAGLYVLLVLALAVGSIALPAIWGGVRSDGLRNELMSPREITAKLDERKADAIRALEAKQAAARDAPAKALREQLVRAEADRAVVRSELGRKPGWFDSLRPATILERKNLELRAAALDLEIGLLDAAVERRDVRDQVEKLKADFKAAHEACVRANKAVDEFNRRSPLDQSVRNVLEEEADQLTVNARKECEQSNRLFYDQERVRSSLAEVERRYVQVATEADSTLSKIPVDTVRRTLQDILLKAAIVLAGIIAAPYAIRVVFYFILAPLAERRPAIQIRPPAGSAMGPAPLDQVSATSAPITLQPGEELLVRQGFLQSTSTTGRKSTCALLDWRHPLSSVASGLVFLTRIEGEGETTVVSAVRDPFAEVAVLRLPVGATCVLQPRALAAVVQPTGRPIRITSHWRLGSLHAWLTLQLRYLMFHGPARLVITGTRGVRVERVERGRVFGQEQLVGFSANLTYSVSRTETFWPYFFGLEQLLKDKVESGEGVLIVEEAPLAGRASRGPRKGLEGAADVVLKAFGL